MRDPVGKTRLTMAEEKKLAAFRMNAILTGFSSRQDGSVGFRGVTPELDSEEKVALFNLQNLNLEVVIFPQDEQFSGAIVKVSKHLDTKTPSQRLRDVIFVHFKQQQEFSGEFELFYGQQMNKIIEGYKTKNLLDPNTHRSGT